MTARKPPKLKIKQCVFCLEDLVWDSGQWAYRCPNPKCNGEFYRDPLDITDNPNQTTNLQPDPRYICRSNVGTTAPGGNSSGKKYGKKERMKKPTTQEIYNKLCNR